MAFDPNKTRNYGSTADVVSRLFQECGGVPTVMKHLNLSRTRCYALADPDDPAEISFDRVATLTRLGAKSAAEHLAVLAGGSFLPVAGTDTDDETDWHAMAADVARAGAALTAAMLESMGPAGRSPGAIDRDEARTLLGHVDRLMSQLARKRALLATIADDRP